MSISDFKKKMLNFKGKVSDHKIMVALFCLVVLLVNLSAYFLTYGEFVSKFNGYGDDNSSVTSTTVIIDDLKADYNYYMGKNYTHSDNTAVPTTTKKNKYNDSNLVQTKVIYDGRDFNDSSLVGHVSRSEQQYLYNYYKIYPINNNGTSSKSDDYIEFELLDAPFSARPQNQVFNGWVCDVEGSIVTLDSAKYVRYAKVPVSYNGDEPKELTITFHASWVVGSITTVSSSRTWATAFGALDAAGLKQITTTHTVYDDPSVNGYFLQGSISTTLSVTRSGTGWNRTYTEGDPNYGTCTDCYTSDHVHHDFYQCPKPTYSTFNWGNSATKTFTNTCDVYYLQDENDSWDQSKTYYQWSSNQFRTVTLSQIPRQETLPQYNHANMAGYFKKVTVARNSSYAGYYNSSGVLQTSGTCTTNGGCTYYELLQNDVTSMIDSGSQYYYLVTRDTNIIQMTTDMSNTWGSSQNKPFTLTADLGYGTNYTNSIRWRIRTSNNSGIVVQAYNDTAIENIRIDYNAGVTGHNEPATNTTTNGYFFGNFHNVKFGRGIIRYNTNGNFLNITGGNRSSTGSSSNLTKYKLIIQSGFYSTVGVTDSSVSNSSTQPNVYVDSSVEYGNDYDRAAKDNSKLDISFCASGSWGGNIRSNDSNNVAINTVLKSGKFGSNEYDLTTGIYVGGRYGGTHYAVRVFTMEGGYVYNLIGGPLSASSRAGQNDIFMYIKGGEIAMITGGAGTSATYGNRIIQITGGKIDYSVFGGSNGQDGDDGDGTLNGSPYVYVGGSAVIGDQTLVSNNSTLWGAEAGSIFGIGNGNSSYATIGSADNSYVVINSNALIRRNVYGGGNYSAVGVSSNTTTTESVIKINGGNINGNVYGGGNRNGTGDTSTVATVNIEITGGTVDNAIYGGANEKGTIYGNVNINMIAGETDYIYGGGRGGYTNNTNSGTYVARNVTITVGDSTSSLSPTINESVYGGSAFGTVNGTTRNGTVENYNTNVIINKGTVNQVFGGGQGNSTYTPYVKGNVTVTVNGGEITDVFGGNDAAGIPNGSIKVYLKGGKVTSAYGGGNNTGANTTNVYLQGTTAGSVFGGSNQTGNVTTTNVLATSGRATNIYGGNNIGGSVTTANVTIDGATITDSVYGGGNLVNTTTAVVNVDAGDVYNVFGGGNSASLTNPSNVTITGGTVNNVYGGSNQTGNVPSSNVYANGGIIENIFGANNAGGATNTTNIKLQGATVTGSVYGGGNEATSEYSHIELKSGDINNIFGGGNSAGLISSDIKLSGGSVVNVYGGSNQTGNVNKSNIVTERLSGSASNLVANNVYGGNNHGGKTSDTNISLTFGDITNVYGGGNEAPIDVSHVNLSGISISGQVYGGGNASYVTSDTNLRVLNTTVNGSIFGGGNAGGVSGNTNVYVTSSNIGTSIYAGGNGSSAIVSGNTNVIVDGTTTVDKHVFGGGNAAATGLEEVNNSNSNVSIAGGNIGGNVYGGANTSVVYGGTNLYIGYDTISNNTNLVKGDIHIGGTIFGGGEANESGSEEYDFTFISVTKNILINIDGNGHDNFNIDGSIFGSGNASSSAGDSYVYIKNYGTRDDIKHNISIQRAKEVDISNSNFTLSGASDRTNEFNNELFTISRVDLLKIKNNTSLYLETSANLLKHFMSLVDIGSNEVLATVIIDPDTGEVTRNVDNRVYTLEGKHLNILTAESLTSNSYGDVDGMSFFGMYRYGRNHSVETGLYNPIYDASSNVPSSDLYYFSQGSYVLGAHKPDHDTTIDGFYSNYLNEEAEGRINVKYVDVTPPDSTYYMWTIGEQVDSYEMNLTASKYLTLGTQELQLVRHANPNTTFTVVGFNYSLLNDDVNLLPEINVPRIASSSDMADNNMGLVMKTPSSGWMTNGSTSFLSNEDNPYTGTTTFRSENSSNAPTFQFYLYHSKNLGTSGDMGTVTISLLAVTRIDDLTNEAERINIDISLSRMLFNTNDYEASIATGKHYDLFSTEQVNTTTDSSISTYFSLYASDATRFYRTGYHRSLVSDYVFPENTKITMIDYHNHDDPEYYYYVVSASDVSSSQAVFNRDGEVAYNFSKFVRMGSTSPGNHYDDAVGNSEYYNQQANTVNEEFVFIVDFSGANINQDVTNKSLLIELRDASDNVMVSVLGPEQQLMFYNLYHNKNAIIDIGASLDSTNIHPGDSVGLNVTTDFITQSVNSNIVTDSSYYDKQLGIKITLFDQSGNQVTGASLLGVSYTLDGVNYYPRTDGTLRLNISERITNVSSRIKFNTTDSIAPGNYTMKIESFGSADGIYYGLYSSDYTEVDFCVLDTVYGLKVTLPEKQVIVSKETGHTLNKNNIVLLNYKYNSVLNNPNIHISLQRRKYDAIYSKEYEDVDFKDYFTNDYISTSVPYEYVLSNDPVSNSNVDVFLYLKDNLRSGTYKIVLSLYDGNTFIGDDYQYIIIK